MNTPHILIVEDDKDIGLLVAKYLKANEMRVTIAENGRPWTGCWPIPASA